MINLRTSTGLLAVAIAVAAGNVAPASAKHRAVQRAPQQILCGPAVASMTAAQMLESIREETGGGRLAVLGSTTYLRYPDGTLGRISPCRTS